MKADKILPNDSAQDELLQSGEQKKPKYEPNAYESQMTMMEMEPHELSTFSVIAYFNTSAQEGLNQGQVLKNRGDGNYNVLNVSSSSCCSCLSAGASKALPPNTKVTRDGKVQIMATKELVKGDLVHIKKNTRIGADIRLIKATDIKVDNEIFGSTAGPTVRTAEADAEHKDFLEITNMLYAGTLVTSGTGQGIVVNTGLMTQLGKKLLEENQAQGSGCSVM